MLDPRSHIRELYSFQGARERERHAAAAATAAAAEHRGRGEMREAAITAAVQLDRLSIINMLLINNPGKAVRWSDVAEGAKQPQNRHRRIRGG